MISQKRPSGQAEIFSKANLPAHLRTKTKKVIRAKTDQKMSSTQLQREADRLLKLYGFDRTGSPVRKKNRSQEFFEKRIIRTPMGNGIK